MRLLLLLASLMVYHQLTCSPWRPSMAFAALISPSSTQQNATTAAYEWKDWDFYRILGLDSSESARITSQDVRKAYRGQAKLYHPDKVRGTSGNSNAEETNARFARIAEAYEVLSHDETRGRYDRYLISHGVKQKMDDDDEWLDYGRGGVDDYDYQWHFDLQDAWRVFENAFEQLFDMGMPHFASTASFFEDFRHRHFDKMPSTPPSLTSQEEFHYVDMATGAEILRVVQTFEYPDDDGSRRGGRRRRVSVAQDFVEDWDPFQHMWVYRPISDPMTVVQQDEEEEAFYNDKDYSRSRPKQPKLQYQDWNQLFPDCILWPNQVMVEGSILEQPPFRAGLVGCELQIRQGDRTLWSSSSLETIYSSSIDSCRLQLQGSQLIVVSSSTGLLYWSSEPDDDAEELDLGSRNNDNYYMARLDKDATLTVYRISEEPAPPTWVVEVVRLLFPLSVMTVSPNMNLPHHQDQERILLPWQLRCVYSTGPARCNRLGRFLVHSLGKLGRVLRRWLHELNVWLDSFE